MIPLDNQHCDGNSDQPSNKLLEGYFQAWTMAQSGQQLAHGPLPLQGHFLPTMQEQIMLSVAQANATTGLAFQHPGFTGTTSSVNETQHHPSILQLAENTSSTSQHLMQPQIPPALALTVQDFPLVPPVYNGVNLGYPGLHLINAIPPIYVVENFLTPYECEFLVTAANDSWSPAPVVGKGAGEISTSRTSSTCYLAREDLPDYMRKISMLTGKPVEHCELPQVGRYLHTQQYLQHFDAFDLSNEDGRRFAANGGQRVVTVLVYLNDVPHGGATHFPVVNLHVQPRQGMALVFFPATVDGLLDRNALHAALPASEQYPKYVSQVWIRQGVYHGQPSKRLPQTLGIPFH